MIIKPLNRPAGIIFFEPAEERGKVAGYLAKYAIKHTECVGGLDRRLKADGLALLPVPEHMHQLVVVAWRLALRESGLRTDRWAHQLGYAGISYQIGATRPRSRNCGQPERAG